MPPESLPGVRRLIEQVGAQMTRLSASAESRSADLSTHLRRYIDRPLPEFMLSAQRFLGSGVPMVVICDQFEEIFVHYYNTPAITAFVDGLCRICADPSIRMHFLFSMREDWVGSMITFRRTLPDVFNCSFRLDPIRRSKALPALTLPPLRRGVKFEDEAADVILSDLCDFYQRQQRMGSASVRLSPSSVEDPFIELPALQAVGDRMWKTKGENAGALTLEHYRSLVPPQEAAESGSPAAAILEHYLSDMLRSIDDGKGEPDSILNELRLDVLYLLTDKTAHRRATGERELLSLLRSIRPSELKLPEVNIERLHEAIYPLKDGYLIREEPVLGGEVRYELAHDFVVRSVVKAWTELDRRRITDLAILSRRHDEVERRVGELSRMERTGLLGAIVLPVFVVGALACVVAFLDAPGIPRAVLWLEVASALMLLTVGAITRLRVGICLAALGFVGCLGPYAPSGARDMSIYVSVSSRRDLGLLCLAVGFLLMACYAGSIAAFAKRWPTSELSQQKWSAVFAECVDVVVFLTVGGLCLFAVTQTPLSLIVIVPDSVWPAAFVLSLLLVYAFASAVILNGTRRSLGMYVAGVRGSDNGLSDLSFLSLLGRQTIFGLWAVLNIIWLLPAILARVFTRSTGFRFFYDDFAIRLENRRKRRSSTQESEEYARAGA